ncbi:unnamed protein product [Camellia sinensis]
MDAAKLDQLKQFIDQCKSDPCILTDPSLSFFTDYLQSLGCKLPHGECPHNKSKPYVVEESDEDLEENEEEPQPHGTAEEEEESEIVESDLEFEGETVEPDNDPPQKMGDPSVEVTEENRDAAQEAKAKAMEAISEGKPEEAIEHLSQAILLNPTSAIMYATRASVYIKMKKPNAAIRDANAALEINPDSAKGYKSRGMAWAMLGQWGEAAKDLHLASKLDYDEEISAVLKKVEPNAHKIEEHRRKYEKLRKEREERKIEHERQRRRAEAQAAYEKAKRKEQSSSSSRAGGMPGGFPGGFPGGMPAGMGGMPGGFPGGMPAGMGGMPGGFPGGMPAGMGGMPGGMGGMPGGMGGMPGGMGGMPNIDYSKILNDPELMAAFKDPEVMTALQDGCKKSFSIGAEAGQSSPQLGPAGLCMLRLIVMKNPANLAKHQANPKVAPIIAKMMGYLEILNFPSGKEKLSRMIEKNMVPTLEAIKGGGGSIKVGSTGTIGTLMSRELESTKSDPQTPRKKSPTVSILVPSDATTPKILKPRTSLDEASSSSSIVNKKSTEIAGKQNTTIGKPIKYQCSTLITGHEDERLDREGFGDEDVCDCNERKGEKENKAGNLHWWRRRLGVHSDTKLKKYL